MKKQNIFLSGLFCLLVALPVQAKLRVVTTTQDLAALARAVGGDNIEVTNLTPGTRDPHFATAKPSMIRKVFRADLLLLIGADMEIGWLPALLQSARNSKVQSGGSGHLDLSTVVPLLGKPQEPVTRAMGDVHAKGNPHYWLDPRNGILMAQAISRKLGQLDPEHTSEYETRFNNFKSTMTSKLPQWQRTLTNLKDKPVISYHTSFIYLANTFGFHLAGQIEPKPGIAPSASYLSQLVQKIKREHIDLLILEPYFEQRSSRYLNEQTGIRVAILPHSVGAQPGIETYVDLFDHIVSNLQTPEGQ